MLQNFCMKKREVENFFQILELNILQLALFNETLNYTITSHF